jgi:hypothetical protein
MSLKDIPDLVASQNFILPQNSKLFVLRFSSVALLWVVGKKLVYRFQISNSLRILMPSCSNHLAIRRREAIYTQHLDIAVYARLPVLQYLSQVLL